MGVMQADGQGGGGSGASVQLLGAIRFAGAAGAVDLPSPSQRRLVAVLAVHAGTTVRGALLCDLLGVQAGALRATVSRTRRLIGADALRTDAVGYRLAATTDISRFGDLVSAALADPRVEAFDAALGVWRGPAIDEFADEPWAAATVAHADELRCVAIEGRASELIRTGRSGEAAAELGMHVADHPLRDRAQGLLMIALAAQGRQAEALRTFQAYRSHLAEHVGTVPSNEVRDLERWVANDGQRPLAPMWPVPAVVDPSALRTPAEPIGDVPLVVPAPRSGDNVPVFRASFVGRQVELRHLLDDLRPGRVVTIVGEGGVGKTRLAARASEELSGQGTVVWFVELAAVPDADAVIGTVAAQVGSPLENGLAGLEAFIGERNAVLVLDNCEHVVEPVADLVDGLLTSCPGLTVMATSREPLCADGERIHRVHPLDPRGDAAELFHDRAEAAGAVLRPDQRDEVETICERLDGNPLAIELAAPRVAALGLRTVIDGLDDRFTLLAGGRRHGDARHRSLHAVVEWSDRLLTAHDRAVFRTLGVFSGGFELDAAQHVLAAVGLASEPVLPAIVTLVNRSMVVAEPGPNGTRFRLLDTLRAYALDQLRDSGGLTAAAAAQAAWIASITDVPLERWMTGEVNRRAVRLEREVDNWRDAMRHAAATADPSMMARLCGAPMGTFLWGRPDLLDLAEALDEVVASRANPTDPPDALDVAVRAGVAYARWGRAWLRLDLDALADACDRLDALAPDDVTGISATIRAATELVGGDLDSATAIRAAAIADPRIAPGGRDLSLAFVVYGACSGGRQHTLPDAWVARAAELARSSDVAAIRRLARVALAWVLVDDDAVASVTLMHEGLSDPEPMPSFWDRLTQTFVSRFLTQASPARAATQLLGVLPQFDAGMAAADAVALVTSAGLIASSGHPSADDVVATVAAAVPIEYLGTFVRDVADRRARGQVLGSDQLVPVLRLALEEIAGRDGWPADAPL